MNKIAPINWMFQPLYPGQGASLQNKIWLTCASYHLDVSHKCDCGVRHMTKNVIYLQWNVHHQVSHFETRCQSYDWGVRQNIPLAWRRSCNDSPCPGYRTQGCVKVQLWCDKVTEIGASMSIVLVVKLVHSPIVCQNGPSKIFKLVRGS